MTTLTIFSALALRAPFAQLLPDWQRLYPDVELDIHWQPSKVLEQRVNQGEAADIIIATVDTLDRLIAQQQIVATSRVEVVDSPVGLAVLAGQPKPDITDAQKLIDALCAARSVAWSEAGASGLWFTEQIKKLGIDTRLRARATVIPSGFTAQQLINGQADLAVQQISELLMVPGIDIVGPFPPDLQHPVSLSAGRLTHSHVEAPADHFLTWLKSDLVSDEFAKYGMVRRD